MPRYVLIEIEDNQQAQDFVEGRHVQIPYEVVAMYAKPVNFCTCVQEGLRKVNGQSAIGTTYGWIVCRLCKKAVLSWQYPNNPEDVR
jgi:hypothetical protein